MTAAETRPESRAARYAVLAYLAVVGIVLLLMMLFGLGLRMAQSGWLPLEPAWFYVVMTMHGTGAVGVAGLAGAAVMFHFIRRHIPVHTAVFVTNLLLFLVGAVLILGSGFLGGYGSAWTFLYPLPAQSGGLWSSTAAASFMVGLLLIGVGFLLLHLDVLLGVTKVYGGLWSGLGGNQVTGSAPVEAGPPPSVVAGTMASIVNVLAITAGAVVLLLSLVNLFMPSFAIDALAAKTMIYFFGHTFINSTIYMSIIAVYEILPLYAGRKWKKPRMFYLAWVASTLLVLGVFPHHLLMDFAMPKWALMVGQVGSWMAGFPVLLITAFGTLTVVYRSGIRWGLVPGLLFASVLGWGAGVIPAIADATITVNSVMHNTLWVPGHFHTYLLLGVFSMTFGFMLYMTSPKMDEAAGGVPRLGFWLFVVGGSVFVLGFLAAGAASVPRRFAEHLPAWQGYDRIGTLGAAVAIVGAILLIGLFLVRLAAGVPADEAPAVAGAKRMR